jgi:hypothetical protein
MGTRNMSTVSGSFEPVQPPTSMPSLPSAPDVWWSELVLWVGIVATLVYAIQKFRRS